MTIGDLPVFNLLKDKLNWHQTRQKLLSENVANADTPGFKPSDLKQLDPSRGPQKTLGVGTMITNRAHIVASLSGSSPYAKTDDEGWETSPSDNGVVLEEQMMKLTENQMDYQAATALYTKGLAMLRSAVRSG